MRLPTVRDSNADELRAFDGVCERLSGFENHLSSEYVDGFLTALAAGPNLPPEDDWLAALGEGAFERAFGDPAAHAKALHALRTRLAVLRAQLDAEALFDQPEALRLNPLMNEWDDASRAALVAEGHASQDEAAAMQTGVMWAIGVLDGIEAFAELWPEPTGDDAADHFDELRTHISALALPPDDPELAAHIASTYSDKRPAGPPDRDDLIAQACFAVQDLRLFAVDHAPVPATRRVEKTPGRNDVCPCGSGKKFKKCHGAVAP